MAEAYLEQPGREELHANAEQLMKLAVERVPNDLETRLAELESEDAAFAEGVRVLTPAFCKLPTTG